MNPFLRPAAMLAASLCLAAPLHSTVTDFFIVLPKRDADKPMVRVLDDQQGIQSYGLGEPFDEVDASGARWSDSVGWWWWHNGPAFSYVAFKSSRAGGDERTPAWFTLKRVGADGKESFRKGPVRFVPCSISAGCRRVACLRPSGEAADGYIVLDAQGKEVWTLAKAGLGVHTALSPSGVKFAYVDAGELVIRDLDAKTETRDSLTEVRNVTGTHDPNWVSGLQDDGTVVYQVQMLQSMSTDGGQQQKGELLKSYFRHAGAGSAGGGAPPAPGVEAPSPSQAAGPVEPGPTPTLAVQPTQVLTSQGVPMQDWTDVEPGKTLGSYADSNGTKIQLSVVPGPAADQRALFLDATMVNWCGAWVTAHNGLGGATGLRFAARSNRPLSFELALMDAGKVQVGHKVRLSGGGAWETFELPTESFSKTAWQDPQSPKDGVFNPAAVAGLSFSPQGSGPTQLWIGPLLPVEGVIHLHDGGATR